jgi:NADPH:quinone reductase-like Zn-dependent oxidoreductase
VLLTSHGAPEGCCATEAPDPVAAPGEVLFDIDTASVNAADCEVRSGGGVYTNIWFSHIHGQDFSGVVGGSLRDRCYTAAYSPTRRRRIVSAKGAIYRAS